MQFILFISVLLSIGSAMPDFQSKLETAERDASQYKDRIDALQEGINIQTSAIADMEISLKNLDSSIQSREMLIRERVRATIMYTVPDRMDFLRAVNSYDDFIRGEAIISHMLRHDVRLYKSYSGELARINELRVLLDAERAKMLGNRQILRTSLEKLKDTVLQKKMILKEAHSDKNKYLAYIEHINRGASQISGFVKGPVRAVKVSPLIKDFVSPAKEGKIVKRYGRIRQDRNAQNNRGITIELPYGTDIYSVSGGVVKFSGWILGYGKVMIIEHGGGLFSIYGHLAKTVFNVGEKVKKGASIALSGDTGSVENAALYFELKYRDKNIDPTQIFKINL
jgi:murein hydrolase activator